jgi:hypothetical protein
MTLFSTTLTLKNKAVPYQVYKEGDRLFFKPADTNSGTDAPIFWVRNSGGVWKPINITDIELIKQVQANIAGHFAEVQDAANK